MTKQDLAKTTSMFAQEVLSALHLPGAVALNRSVEAALKKRFDEGVEALISELERGGREGVTFGEDDHDEFVQMLLRFGDAQRKGTSTRNLRLLGRLIVGLKADGSFYFDEFSTLTNALEGLSLASLKLLARMYKLRLEHQDDNSFWHTLREKRPDEETPKELIAQLNSLLHTGFVVALSGWGSLVYLPAPALTRLGELAGWSTTGPDEAAPL